MQYLVISAPKTKFETDGMAADVIEMEIKQQAQTQVLSAKCGLRQVWALDRKQEGAAVLFAAASTDHLQQMIDSSPLITVDYADYQLLPLAPWPPSQDFTDRHRNSCAGKTCWRTLELKETS